MGKKSEIYGSQLRAPQIRAFESIGSSFSVVDEDKHRMVDVETREFEYQAKRFLETI